MTNEDKIFHELHEKYGDDLVETIRGFVYFNSCEELISEWPADLAQCPICLATFNEDGSMVHAEYVGKH